MVPETTTVSRPIISEVCPPKRMRESRSRPSCSVPNRYPSVRGGSLRVPRFCALVGQWEEVSQRDRQDHQQREDRSDPELDLGGASPACHGRGLEQLLPDGRGELMRSFGDRGSA